MKAKVKITLKEGILDPQGKAVEHSLRSLGYGSVKGVRVGKYIEVDVEGKNERSIKENVESMCKKLLSNPVTENFEITL